MPPFYPVLPRRLQPTAPLRVRLDLHPTAASSAPVDSNVTTSRDSRRPGGFHRVCGRSRGKPTASASAALPAGRHTRPLAWEVGGPNVPAVPRRGAAHPRVHNAPVGSRTALAPVALGDSLHLPLHRIRRASAAPLCFFLSPSTCHCLAFDRATRWKEIRWDEWLLCAPGNSTRDAADFFFVIL
jgi:hypothetical protein